MEKLRSQERRGLAEGLQFLLYRETRILQNMPLAGSELEIPELPFTIMYKILKSFMNFYQKHTEAKLCNLSLLYTHISPKIGLLNLN